MLLYCMAVFSSFPIPFKEVEIAFDKLQEEIEPFETLVSKLRGSWINTYYIIDEQGEIKYIDFINPSIFDYINKLLLANYKEYIKFDDAMCFEQNVLFDFAESGCDDFNYFIED